MRNNLAVFLAAFLLPLVAEAGDLLDLYDKAQKNDATFNAARRSSLVRQSKGPITIYSYRSASIGSSCAALSAG